MVKILSSISSFILRLFTLINPDMSNGMKEKKRYHFSSLAVFDLKDLKIFLFIFFLLYCLRSSIVNSSFFWSHGSILLLLRSSSSFWIIRLLFFLLRISRLISRFSSFFLLQWNRNVTRKKWTDTIYLASLLCSN